MIRTKNFAPRSKRPGQRNAANERREWWRSSLNRAIASKGRSVLPRTLVPQDIEARKVSAEFAAIIRPFPDKTVAREAAVVEKTVQHWRHGRSLPSMLSTLKLANSGSQLGAAVGAWIRARHGGGDAEFYEPHASAELEARIARLESKMTKDV